MSSSQKPSATLSHMPWFIKKSIVHSTDPVSRLNLRLCSREFNHYAQSAPTDYDNVKIWVEDGIAYFDYSITDGSKVLWSSFQMDCSVDIDHFAKLLKHKISSIETLEISLEDSEFFLDSLVEYLQKRDTPLCVRKIVLEMAESELVPWIHRIVSQLKPGVLETINLEKIEEIHPDDMEALGDSQQWKKAKWLEMSHMTMELPYSKWAHLKFPQLTVEDLPVEAVKDIMERFCRNPSWKEMRISHNGKFDRGISTYFRQFGLGRASFPRMIRNPLNDTETISVQVSVTELVAHRHGIYGKY